MKIHISLRTYLMQPGMNAFWLFMYLFFLAGTAKAQINSYGKVTAIAGTTLSLSNVNQTYHTFAAGEQIIVMQMQDNVIGANTGHNSSFGTLSAIAGAGLYEIATINSVAGMPSSLTITAALSNTYTISTSASLQIISFNNLSATNYTTSSNITGVAWNGNVGGVVAFQVGGTLTLANSVSADGLGFRGGAVSSNYEVTCEPNVYDTTSANYAYKGEGIYTSTAINYTNQTGRAPLLSGGGGGSDDNGGGGGGGNYTAGGQGGQGWTCSAATASGGLGGISLGSYTTGYSRIFMGGGGGGGQQNNTLGTAGTTGGGIVIIKANTLTTSCSGTVKISANGVAASTSGNDGAGGGGAGGTVAMQVNTYSVPSGCPLTLQANGGNGGNVGDANAHGGGGGGGQGAVVYSGALPSSNMTTTTSNGTGGLNSSSGGAASASGGGGTSNTGIITTSITLPIKFVSFKAEKSGTNVNLNWVTGIINQYTEFNIQHSVDGTGFQTIGTAYGNINDAAANSFSFTDQNPGSSKNYYRIEEVDLSGKKIYSAIAIVDFYGAANTFSIFPNPSNGQFSIRLEEANNAPLSVTIDDMAGKTVYTKLFQTFGNIIPVRLTSLLASGIYIIKLNGNGQTRVGKLVIK